MKDKQLWSKLKNYKMYVIGAGSMVIVMLMMFVVWLVFPSDLDKSEAPYAKVNLRPLAGLSNTPAIRPSMIASSVTPDYYLPRISGGMSPVVSRLKTNQNIVFLTIDDGAYKDKSVIDMMKDNDIKASLFLSKVFIANNPDFFKALIDAGSYVEDHTISHNTKMSKEMSLDQQKVEICGMANYEQSRYGRRPTLFRPPGGEYSDTMLQAAAHCGMKAVVIWAAKANGGSMQYQVGKALRPGDIVLMHFRPEFKQDMQAFIDAMVAADLHTALLEDAL